MKYILGQFMNLHVWFSLTSGIDALLFRVWQALLSFFFLLPSMLAPPLFLPLSP